MKSMAQQIDTFDVGPSRDGDQFHYSRASRLCLELLQSSSDLQVVSVEGISKQDSVNAGIESIDLALYYGSTSLSTARLVRYRQLKHSTLHADKEWTASGLRKTLKDFSDRFTALAGQFGIEDVRTRFAFEFETNRPISSKVEQALAELTRGTTGRYASYISRVTGLAPADLQVFASLFRPITRVEGFLEQRSLLNRDLRAYLPDNDKDAAIALRELVARKATSEFRSNHEIRREDVLDTIGTRLDELFPAPNVIDSPAVVVPRAQMPDLLKVIIDSQLPVIVSADGGCGKSVVATQIGAAFSDTAFVYDCFGNGGYRSATGLRHRAKDGLVQLANEMASHGLCHPLIPTPKADDSGYVRAFLARVEQASIVVRSRSADAHLILILDAADNAEMAAEEFHHPPSFPRLLLTEALPDNVRLVLTSRPHRIDKLHPPPGVTRFDLDGFTQQETEHLLRTRFTEIVEADVLEFHRLTSRNPRVQRTALDLDPAAPLATVLRSLGPSPRTVDDTIADLLERAVSQTRHAASAIERTQIDRICAALATLRPFVPIRVIALTAGVDEGLVRSFVHDLGKPLLIREDSVQFRDEPTETWFQEHFRPGHEELDAFVRRLRPLARESRYAASALPALMLSTDRFDELVHLALDDDALPENDEIARRDVELQRLEFATLAALRARRYADAAKLALKAGGRVAADGRQQTLLSGNVDLASQFLDGDQLVEQVSRRQIIGGNWTGSEHAYEAALLSGREGLKGEARAQLRIAYDWLNHWLRNRRRDDYSTSLEDGDILELQWAELNIHGPARCADQLRRWRPREISYRVGRLLGKRLVDGARWEDAEALAISAGNDIGLVLAVAEELRKVERQVPKHAAKRIMRLLFHPRVRIESPGDWRGDATRVGAISSIIETAQRYRLAPKRKLASLLRRYLPKSVPGALESEHLNDDRIVFLRAYALLAGLSGKSLTLEVIYGSKRNSRKTAKSDFSGRGFENLKALIPWHELSVKVRTGALSQGQFATSLSEALESWTRHRRDVYQDWSATADEVARLWSECIVLLDGDETLWSGLVQWQEGLRIPLFIPTLADLARRAALTKGPPHVVLSFAKKARSRIGEDTELAESMADSFVLLSRAVLGASKHEALQYFSEAVRVASNIGQENLERWHALLNLSDACTEDKADDPRLAHRFARAAELTRSYVDRDKHFDWEHTVEAIATLSPRTAPAIMSRWRDRRFGEPERFLPQLVEFLCKRGNLDGRDGAALICFEGHWDWSSMISMALDAAGSRAEKDKLLTQFYRYLRFSASSKQHLKMVANAVQQRGLEARPFRELEQRARRFESGDVSHEDSTSSARQPSPDWEAVFEGIDLATTLGLLESQSRMPDERLGRWRERWIEEAVGRVHHGMEGEFLKSLESIDEWNLYAVHELLERIPSIWVDGLALRKTLASFVDRTVREHATSLDINRYHQPLPFDLVYEKTGLSRQDLLRSALDAIAETSLPTSSRRLFQLVGITAQFLNPAEARSVLGYGLEHLEDSLGYEQGDGPWSPHLEPAGGCRESVAGYIWAALGAVESGRRWQAAHAVRALCFLGRDSLFADLVALATGGSAVAFTDASLHFYRMHALQWLLTAVDRASRESAQAVARHAQWLESLASRKNRHVISRGMAARTLLNLADQAHLEMDSDTRNTLIAINSSHLPTQFSATHTRLHRNQARPNVDCEFTFGYDFSRSWIEPLARAFAIYPREIEEIACRVIREQWGLHESGDYNSDVRAQRGQFKEDLRHRGNELGGKDNLSFYLSYHALMEAAGQLLETHPLHEDLESSWGSFSYWLLENASFDPKGDWLADSRQLPPTDVIEFPAHEKGTWPVPAAKSYALSRIMAHGEAVVAAGRWTQYAGRNSESLRVVSALASRTRAGALARALATTRNPYDYALPDFQDTHEIHHGDYVLEGWVTEAGKETGADSDDPWAGELSRRFPDIAGAVADELGITLDEASGEWHQNDGTCVAWVERWGERTYDEDGRSPSGERLLVDMKFLKEMLDRQGRTLIIEVTCDRRVVPFNYQSRAEDVQEERATSIIRIEAAGSPCIVGFSARPRRKAHRRA
ncbi:hypothetical protein CVO74_22455 [Xanthomonas prunicola]|uniref:NACHT domain-containing protein n=2 Tax=Xanthomonas prunicola TaxID=2053930 RepID=A0A2N3REV7_9XANT|nr:hypothetical protein XpruCFBP8353_20280 [Xanthomonas prunicola]PKV19165.1 hypothetical protein CVO74_22455 [Xanthomonas prunicola]